METTTLIEPDHESRTRKTMRSSILATAAIVSAIVVLALLTIVAPLDRTAGIVGVIAGGIAGGAGAWLATVVVERRVIEQLAGLRLDETSDERQGPPRATIGLPALDEHFAALRQAIDQSIQLRRSYEQTERMVWSLGGNGKAPSNGARPGPLALLDHLGQTTSLLARDAEGLSEVNERMASGALEQSETVSRTTSTVEALSDKIDRISQNAEEAAEACERTRQEARRGLEQVHNVIEGFDRLRAQVEANGRKARRLGDRSMEISTIVELIRGISSRTDMLALNATIESVRAGEHGRGFAVVAEEIRKLAERTANATREIGTLVEAIQADTHESIRALAEEQSDMEQEAQRVRSTGAALERISEVAEHSATLVDGISRSSNDQVLATQDLVIAMQRISEVSFATLDGTTKTRDLLRALSMRCQPMQRLSALDPPFLPRTAEDVHAINGRTISSLVLNGERKT
jgi:methyl-accepting chemotaxis protein